MLTIDLGTYIRERQQLEIAVDAAALAGGLELPDSGTDARNKALEFIGLNDPDVASGDVLTTFRCLVGDRDGDGVEDSSDIPAVCNPGSGNPFDCDDGLCISWCDYISGTKCNVLVVEASKDVPLYFTQLMGLPPVEISVSRNGSCKGLCGSPPTIPLDVIIVIDRSGSMNSSELADAKAAALAVLEIFDDDLQHVGLAVLGAMHPIFPCSQLDAGLGGIWLKVPLSDDYQNPDGSINQNSDLVSTILCLGNSSQGTNLGSPLSDSIYNREDALDGLNASTRPDAGKAVIFLTDGAANEPDPMPGPDNPCEYADDRAAFLKTQDVEIFTIGYGVHNEYCNDDNGPYDFERVTELLSSMATDSADDQGHCATSTAVDLENADGDHFLCSADSADLEEVFIIAAEALIKGIRLIGYPQ
jgi:hypothetical protein